MAYVLMLGLIGGTVGQFMPVLYQPESYVSGASQAYLALSAFALLTLPRKSVGWWTALMSVVIGIALDLFVAKHGGIKPGHTAPMVIGFVIGAIVWWKGRSVSRAPVAGISA